MSDCIPICERQALQGGYVPGVRLAHSVHLAFRTPVSGGGLLQHGVAGLLSKGVAL